MVKGKGSREMSVFSCSRSHLCWCFCYGDDVGVVYDGAAGSFVLAERNSSNRLGDNCNRTDWAVLLAVAVLAVQAL